jgi:hypothetical protein
VATPIPYDRRQAYLERIAVLLADRPIRNGDVLAAACRAQRELIGIQKPE